MSRDDDMLLKNIADWVAREGKNAKEFASANIGSSIQPHVESPLSTYGYARPLRDVRYDVFINHRGIDVKYTLATAIYEKLKDTGLKVFLDSEELRFGDHISRVLEEAIRSAKIHIAIFSPNFAKSICCLSELSLVLQTGARVIPVFYHTHPSDLRYAVRGAYADAFAKHEAKGKYNSETLEGWKVAVYKASFYAGVIVDSVE